ncbi:MAG: GHKL domain-containing protein [Clostridiales bacterium]|nr:GHKL domain-containing protein [Clostridiales bacterium]
MIWIAIDQALLFLECFLFVEFVTRFNRIDWTRRACRVAMILAWAASFLIVLIPGPLQQDIQARLLIRTAILFLYTLYFLEGTIIGKILSCLFFPFALMTSQILVAVPLQLLPGSSWSRIWENTGLMPAIDHAIALLLTFYATRVFLKFRAVYFQPYRRTHVTVAILVPLITLISISMLITALPTADDMTRVLLLLAVAGTTAANLILYYLIGSLGREGSLVRENDMLRALAAYEEHNIDERRMLYEQTRSIRHEMKNYLTMLEQYIQGGRTKEALESIEMLRGKIEGQVVQIQSPNETLNFILNTALAQAATLKIRPKVLIEESRITLTDLDLYSLLGNMLNNAIEALSHVPETDRDMHIEIRRKGGYTAVQVRNRILHSVLQDNPDLKTTKEHESHHGYGVRIIKDVAERAGGLSDFFEQEDWFVVQVLIPLLEEETDE